MFQEYNIAAMSEVPALIGSFAQAVGFTVNTANPNAPIITTPGGTLPITVSYATRGSGAALRQTVRAENVANTFCAITSAPRRRNGANSTSVPVQVAPTKLIMIGGLLPQPYIAAVIAFGFNLYRHLYIGNMEKIGNYTGGEVVAGSFNTDSPNYDCNFRSSQTQYLFNSWNNTGAPWTDNECGAVRVTHADNPSAKRVFRQIVGDIETNSMTLTAAIGGFKDDINDGYLMRGESSYSGAAILVPFNLYAVRPSSRISAIGRVAGVRMVRMDDIEPEVTITVGGEQWYVVPMFRKSANEGISFPAYGYPTDETSYLIGMAYKK